MLRQTHSEFFRVLLFTLLLILRQGEQEVRVKAGACRLPYFPVEFQTGVMARRFCLMVKLLLQ
ncbi:hypothetical protein AYO47_05085 [Planctomyces sp. SCGC AG-212-M04]|nr:hypothetical protein AYO47_05085 [Planctomyces sp. SCGC AG-212-M04]